MLLSYIHDQVRFYAKKAQRGAISPEQIDSAIDQAQLTVFMERLGFPQQPLERNGASKLGLKKNNRIHDDLRNFITGLNERTVTNGVLSLPSNYVFYNSILTETTVDGRIVYGSATEIKADELAFALNSQVNPPTLTNPFIVFGGSVISFYPATVSKVKMSYLRLPAKPKLAYELTSSGRNFTVVEENSTDLEWPKTMANEIIMATLNLLSIPVKDQYNQQVSEMKRQQGS